MDDKESLICQNINSLKSREKKFDHFGDYLVIYATLSGLFANFVANYFPSESEKEDYTMLIALLLEFMYIIAISFKIASHYSVKKYLENYFKNYKREEQKQIISTLEKPNPISLDIFLNNLLAYKLFVRFLECGSLLLISFSAFMAILIKLDNCSSPALQLSFIALYVSAIFPVLGILAFKPFFEIFLIPNNSTFFARVKAIFIHTNHKFT